jgi:hypothetical protein
MNVYQKLNDARVQFHKLQLKKTGLNKFAGYQYFELGDFLIPALNVFHDNGLCAIISFGEAVATMTIFSASDGASVTITSPMAEANLKGCHPIQNLGAVETYTRRYLWVAALEIVEHDALDSSEPVQQEQPVRATYKATPKLSDVASSIKVVSGAKDLDALTKYWNAECYKYEKDSKEFAALKQAAGERKNYLQDMGVAA